MVTVPGVHEAMRWPMSRVGLRGRHSSSKVGNEFRSWKSVLSGFWSFWSFEGCFVALFFLCFLYDCVRTNFCGFGSSLFCDNPWPDQEFLQDASDLQGSITCRLRPLSRQASKLNLINLGNKYMYHSKTLTVVCQTILFMVNKAN